MAEPRAGAMRSRTHEGAEGAVAAAGLLVSSFKRALPGDRSQSPADDGGEWIDDR